MSRVHRLLESVAWILAVFAIGWADQLTGPDLGMSLFYLVPITLAAWRVGAFAMKTVDDMLRAGDEAMYEGKLRGKGKAIVAGARLTA